MTIIKTPGGANEQLINQSNPYSKTQSPTTSDTEQPFCKTNPICHRPFGITNFQNKAISTQSEYMLSHIMV
jgi:hypothetical protein